MPTSPSTVELYMAENHRLDSQLTEQMAVNDELRAEIKRLNSEVEYWKALCSGLDATIEDRDRQIALILATIERVAVEEVEE